MAAAAAGGSSLGTLVTGSSERRFDENKVSFMGRSDHTQRLPSVLRVASLRGGAPESCGPRTMPRLRRRQLRVVGSARYVGRAIGIEITSPARFEVEKLNRVLVEFVRPQSCAPTSPRSARPEIVSSACFVHIFRRFGCRMFATSGSINRPRPPTKRHRRRRGAALLCDGDARCDRN